LKRIALIVLAASAALLASIPALHGQLTAGPAAPASLADRHQALNDLFHDYWEDRLKHDPEFASIPSRPTTTSSPASKGSSFA
jgi:hypothetical protein